MKKIINNILFVLLCVTVFLINITTCSAKSYSVESAIFNVDLLGNGSAIITESWDLSYQGDYSRFYKEIYTNLGNAEKFENFNVINVTIDDVEAFQVYNSEERIDNTYCITTENSLIRIEWFKHVNNTRTNYKITYKVDNVVKKTDNDRALFSYRFVGANFNDTIKNSRLTLNAISNNNIEVNDYKGFNNYFINNNTVTFTGEGKSGLHKVSVLLNLNDYESLQYAPLPSPIDDDIVLYITLFITALPFIAAVLVIVISLRKDKKEKRKVDNIIETQPHYMKELTSKYDSYGMDAIDVSIMYDNKLDLYTILNLMFLYLNSKGKCIITDETIIINKDALSTNEFYKNLIDEIISAVENEEESNKYIIKLESLTDNLKTNRNFRRNITNIYAKYRKRRKKEIKEKYILNDNESYKVLSRLVDELPEYDSKCMYDYYSVAKKSSIDLDTVYSIVFKKFVLRETVVPEGPAIMLMAFCQLSDNYYNMRYQSSSSRGGCSSCSSCGGCGGGGAD